MREEKLRRLRRLLAQTGAGHKIDALWLRHRANVAWLGDGARPCIVTTSDLGVLSWVVTQDDVVGLTSNVECERLQDEEGLQGVRFVASAWHGSAASPRQILPDSAIVATDVDTPGMRNVHTDLVACRAPLDAQECQRYAALGAEVSQALFDASIALPCGLSEFAIAARLAQAVVAVGAWPVVLLVAADARIAKRRHPLPTDCVARNQMMFAVCAERHGLIVSMTRFVAWGKVCPELTSAVRAAATVEAAALAMTQPGAALQAIWERMLQTYRAIGHPEAWRSLHQGGPCSYEPRDVFVRPGCTEVVQASQAFAYNPSVVGGKSEDTVLVDRQGLQILTAGPWPTQQIALPTPGCMARPAVLQLP